MDCCCRTVFALNQKVKSLEDKLNQPGTLKMYRIYLNDYKTTVVCNHCYQNGEVDTSCCECGGKGIHNKTKQRWELHNRLEEIVKVDRDKDGLRYWTDMTSFYPEANGNGCLFFNEKDALDECRRRNKRENENTFKMSL